MHPPRRACGVPRRRRRPERSQTAPGAAGPGGGLAAAALPSAASAALAATASGRPSPTGCRGRSSDRPASVRRQPHRHRSPPTWPRRAAVRCRRRWRATPPIASSTRSARSSRARASSPATWPCGSSVNRAGRPRRRCAPAACGPRRSTPRSPTACSPTPTRPTTSSRSPRRIRDARSSRRRSRSPNATIGPAPKSSAPWPPATTCAAASCSRSAPTPCAGPIAARKG